MVVHTFRTQRQSDLSEFEASLVYSEFQDSQDCYTEKPCLGGEKKEKRKKSMETQRPLRHQSPHQYG